MVFIVSRWFVGARGGMQVTRSLGRPQLYGSFEISVEEVDKCLNLATQAIVLASWLAAVARQELFRFTEFMLFLRYGMFFRVRRDDFSALQKIQKPGD